MSEIVSLIDHAVLHPTQTEADLREACRMCREVGVASVCVKPWMLPLTTELLQGSPVVPSTVIGFPPRRHDHRGQGPRDRGRRPRRG